MATHSGGTAATTTLTGLQFQPGVMSAADVATIDQLIQAGTSPGGGVSAWGRNGAFTTEGRLIIPNRGVLLLLPTDWVFVSPATGLPILLDSATAASANWVHN